MLLITFILKMSIYIGILHVIIELVKKFPESNLSLHRGVWKNSYVWSIHTELMKIDMNLRSWVSFVFLTTPCQTILRPELQPERGCVEKSTFCIVCVSNNPHVKQKINAIHLICTLHWIYFSHQIKLEIWYIRICGLPILSNIEMCVGVFLQGTISTLSMLRFLIWYYEYYTWTVNVRDWVSACL